MVPECGKPKERMKMTPEEQRFKEEIEDLRTRIGAAKKEKEEARDELIIRLDEHTDLLDKHVSLLHEEVHQLSNGIESLNDKLDDIKNVLTYSPNVRNKHHI